MRIPKGQSTVITTKSLLQETRECFRPSGITIEYGTVVKPRQRETSQKEKIKINQVIINRLNEVGKKVGKKVGNSDTDNNLDLY